MTTEKRITLFAKRIEAILKGDDAAIIGIKILKQADSALKTQIASLTGDTISLEDAVDVAETEISDRLVNNAELITDRNSYVRRLLDAKNNLTLAKDNLEAHLQKLAFLKEMLEGLDAVE